MYCPKLPLFLQLVFVFSSASSKGLLFKPSGAITWKMVFLWTNYPYGMYDFMVCFRIEISIYECTWGIWEARERCVRAENNPSLYIECCPNFPCTSKPQYIRINAASNQWVQYKQIKKAWFCFVVHCKFVVAFEIFH